MLPAVTLSRHRRSARGMEFGTEARFSLLIRENMIELYVNDY